MYYKTPDIESNGTLTQENAVSVYNHHLNTEQECFDGIKRKPTKVSILHAMLKNHQKSKQNIIQQYLDSGKRVLFWSDQHFGHQNIIKYTNRPFNGKAHMDKVMIENYFKEVKDDDLVVWVGDVAFCSVTECRHLFNNLPGEKVLIMGNHDFDGKNNFKNFGIFSEVYMAAVFNIKVQNTICNIILSHYPINNKFLPKNTLNVHGHIHDKKSDLKNINVCVEQTDYKPIDISDIIAETFLINS